MLDDTRYTLRTLRRAPMFTIPAVVTIALGLAASTAIFSMVSGVLLQRLPIGAGNRFVHLTQPSSQGADEGFSVQEVRALNAATQTMTAVAEYHSMSFQLYGYGEPLRVQTGVVSDKFFDMLGVKPLLGRTFRSGEEAVGAPPVVVLTHEFWMDQFHGDPSVIGARFTMNDKVHTVVGVLPPMASYPSHDQMFMPAGACPFRSAPMMMNDYGMRMVSAFAVVKPGLDLARAQTELASLGARLHAAHEAAYPRQQRMRFLAQSARDEMTARARPVLIFLFAAAGFLMLGAIANVATLSLSRQMRRAREIAVRVALGAGNPRLYRLQLLEGVYVAGIGGILGVGLAASGVGLLRATATRLTPRAAEIGMSLPVYAFAFVLCMLTAFVIAAVPFAQAVLRKSVADALRQGNGGTMTSRGEHRVRNVLVVAQVAIACTMLVGAGLIGRSLIELARVDAGVDARNVVTARLTLNFTKYNSPQASRLFADAVLERLQSLPGVSAAGLASNLPLANTNTQDLRFQIEGVTGTARVGQPHSDATAVSPGYFRAVGIPLVRGRDFSGADRDTSSPPAVVSQRLARTYWGVRDPIGTRISPDSGRHWMTIVGVVGDVRMTGLDKDITDEIYFPVAASGTTDFRVFLRMNGPMAPVVRALRSAVHDVDAYQPVSSVQTLEQVRGAALAEPRLTTTLLIVFAAVSLVLTATGLGGVIAYRVTERIPEIAVRLALGSSAGRVLLLVMRQGMMIVAGGLLVGFALALEASRLATKLLFQTTPTDPLTYCAVGVMVLATAAIACYLPSRRALRTDPTQVFRAG